MEAIFLGIIVLILAIHFYRDGSSFWKTEAIITAIIGIGLVVLGLIGK